jgi:hypothetical protein
LSLSLPEFPVSNPITGERLDAVKATAFDTYDWVRGGVFDSFEYLRAVSYKSVDEVQKVWNENFGN